MQAAYLKRQEVTLWPLRRIEATLWNVQSAKVKGEQFEPSDLYPLGIDPPATARKKKQRSGPTPKGQLSKAEYQKMMERRFPHLYAPKATD